MRPTPTAAALYLGALLASTSPAGAGAQSPPSATGADPAEIESARDADARVLFQAAVRLLESGDAEGALVRFESAYELSGRAELLYNVGIAADRLRRDERALAAFESYLEANPAAENRASVESRIRTLRASIAADEARRADDRALVSSSAGSDGLTASPWFWTAIAAVAVAAGVTLAVVATSGDPDVEPPQVPPNGVLVMALGD